MDGERDREPAVVPLVGIPGHADGGWSPFVRRMLTAYGSNNPDLINAVITEASDDPDVNLGAEIYRLTGLLWRYIETAILDDPSITIHQDALPEFVAQFLMGLASNDGIFE